MRPTWLTVVFYGRQVAAQAINLEEHLMPTEVEILRANRSLLYVLILLVVFASQALLPAGHDAEAKGKKGKAKASKKAAAYPPEFYKAVRLVYDKKYKDAYEIFERLDRNGYCRDKTHYYIAYCFHNMNQLAQAAQHYQVVSSFSKDPQLKYLAAVGYSQVERYAASRTYAGQGNLFARLSTGGRSWGGGGGGGGGG